MKTLRIPFAGPKDWLKVLEQLANGTAIVTEVGLRRLTRAANSWPTCACGQLCRALPRRYPGRFCQEPADYDLRILGLTFAALIPSQQWSKALRVFRKIEARSIQLLDEMTRSQSSL